MTMRDAEHEARCMSLDISDTLKAKNLADRRKHLQDAIRRHAVLARLLRAELTAVSHRDCVLSMIYPENLGGGIGPDRIK